ncbi:50S ribosomal protein L13 [Candidatus Woesearchaeota archaeon]|nr:MAG: 50S ribosomal protein L13 [Candidatus Woesearchaeota archaeon]
MIIDGENLILGRLASVAAKKALLGEEIIIINCDKIMITGNKKQILARYIQKVQMGGPFKGPFLSRSSDKLTLRAIRNMLPYKQKKGMLAFKRIKCYAGIPEKIKTEEIETIESASINKVPNLKYIKLGRISKLIGGMK